MIAIIDYGVGNLFSLVSSLTYLGISSKVTSCKEEILDADQVIFPGVGAFGDAFSKLQDSGLIPTLKTVAESGTPLLGICVGMQLMFEESFEYGRHPGLCLLPGYIDALEADISHISPSFKVPQMGWNALHKKSLDCPLLRYVEDGDFVYYVHSYYAKGCDHITVATSSYGVSVPGVVQKQNIYGTQFHPEKSGTVGLSILKAFAELSR